MNKTKTVMTMALAAALTLGVSAPFARAADDTVGEKVEETAKDTKRGVKKAVRNVKDETCEMVDGKMKCLGKKAKHKAQNAGDKLEDAVD